MQHYFDHEPQPGTPDADRFDVLSDLIEAYENRRFLVVEQEPVPFLVSFMELTGRSQRDLAQVLNSRSRASEILSLKRALTLDMIHRLNQEWGVPVVSLAKPYELSVA